MEVLTSVYRIKKYRDDVVFLNKDLAKEMLNKIFKRYEELSKKDPCNITKLKKISDEHFRVDEHDGFGNFPRIDYEIEEIKVVNHTNVKTPLQEIHEYYENLNKGKSK